jgi:hypothetical protein
MEPLIPMKNLKKYNRSKRDRRRKPERKLRNPLAHRLLS